MPPTHTDEGIVAAVEARRRRPDLAVLVLSAYVEQAFATDLLAGGAVRLGYLLKERVGRVEEFLTALHRVADGGTAIDPEVVGQLFARSRPDSTLARLSGRERDVLALMAEGLGNGRSRSGCSSPTGPCTSTSAASSPSSVSPRTTAPTGG